MGFGELTLISVGLAMDAFAVAVCKGINMKKLDLKFSTIIAVLFGSFQLLMAFLGWALGTQFENYITSFDHWIAFALLSFIGGKMIFECFKNDNSEEETTFNLKELILLSIATSIDALAIGITFSFLSVNISVAVLLIGFTAFALSFAGVIAGNKLKFKQANKTELIGGIILILIGVKILFEHLGIIL